MNSSNKKISTPDHTAIRVALWRALHVLVDPSPHIFNDEIGSRLVNEDNWRQRPDMQPDFCKSMRASIVARARFVEDLVKQQAKQGVDQYIILGAGLDTFAQRNPDIAALINIFEIDQPGVQEWKRRQLIELGYPIPEGLHFIPVNFESGQSWWDQLLASDFNPSRPAIVVSTGVSMYLSLEANMATLKNLATLAPGSIFAMDFVLKNAAQAKTPFQSLFKPVELLDMAKNARFRDCQYVSPQDLYHRYFEGRSDGLHAGNTEAFMLAKT